MQDRKLRNITKLRSNCKIPMVFKNFSIIDKVKYMDHSNIWNMEIIRSHPNGPNSYRDAINPIYEQVLTVAIYPEDWPDYMIENAHICQVLDRGEDLNSIFQHVVDKMLIAGDFGSKWEFLQKKTDKEKEPVKEEVLTNYDEQRYG